MKEKELELERERLKLEKDKLKFEQYKQGLVERYEVKNNSTTTTNNNNNKPIVLKQQKKKIIKHSVWKSMYVSLIVLFIVSICFSLFSMWIVLDLRSQTSNNSNAPIITFLVLSQNTSDLLLGSTSIFIFVNFILIILLGVWTFKKSDSKKIKTPFFAFALIATIVIIIFLPYEETKNKIFVGINEFNKWKNTFIILNSLNILIMLICLFFVAIYGNKELKKMKIQEKAQIDVNEYETELGSEIK